MPGTQVPPALNRFTKAADKNLAETVFKLLLKYRPEDKAAKKARLLREVGQPSLQPHPAHMLRCPPICLTLQQIAFSTSPQGCCGVQRHASA